ncbi:MAG TPA: HlyD family efflux transporter periplasmic adaptor subunit [Hypericibacter adhaerens]|uniref:HlyD family secretion protein n=1 Tax=Hypericibacter adhaerens TaxID=2602016 RepID=UPI002BD58A71|nr:HlyD family efflux transporter periplasmic adaptor subunit [Hypericibacter adhaerens]HWA46040.1 HlyD family efflux transporter periplasmic adaptor subunit [Hypericibacter adhaerens]
MPHSPMRRRARRLLFGLAIAAVIGAILILGWRPVPPPVIGMVRATEIKIAPEVSGRIAQILVKAGDRVQAGTVVAQLSNPELAAAVEEARATVGAARAARDHVYAGIRQEQVKITAREVDKAKADLLLAQQEYQRTSAVAKAGYASTQKLDEAQAALSTAQANLASLQSQLAEAQHGATPEERAFADAQVAAAEASLAVLERRMDKLQLQAPVDGVVQTVVAEPGEATIPGRTALTLTAGDDYWFSFNVREDLLDGMNIGTALTLTRSGDDKPIVARVSEMRRLGDFATWRAARAIGDHDLNLFAVRADPTQTVPDLEPGMTVWIATIAPPAP